MGKKKGDSFITQPPFEVLIAIVFGFLIIGFMITQSGGINSILKSICDKVPALCAGSVSTVDYKIAKQSTQALTCAINTVLTGKQQCTDVKIVTSLEGHVTAAEGITGAQTSAQTQAGSASISCEISGGYPELEYHAGRSDNVWYVLDSDEQWKWKCPGCGNNAYQSLNSMSAVISKVDNVHKEILQNLLKITSGSADNKFSAGALVFKNAVLSDSYGKDDEIIVHHKYGTSTVSELTGAGSSPYGLNPIYETRTKPGSTETLNRENIGLILNMGLESASRCKVSNFNLPENFAGITKKADEFINGMGDPSFLLYYQKFPAGEDTNWAGEAEWFTGVGKAMFIAMCVADVVRPLKQLKGTIQASVKKASEEVTARLFARNAEKKALEEATIAEAERLAPELAAKAEGEAILNFMKRDSVNNGIVNYFKSKYPGGFSTQVFDDIIAQSGRQFTQAEKEALRKEFMKIWLNQGERSGIDLSVLLADKADPALMTQLMSKAMKKTNAETLARFAKYVGIDYGITYYAALIDSRMGKFIKENPNSLVLGMPLIKEEPSKLQSNTIAKPQKIDYPDKQNLMPIGKNVVLIKKEWGNQPTPFYLASPCMADLTIESKPIACAIYTYNSVTGLTTCDNPDKSEDPAWYNDLFSDGKKMQDCGSLAGGEWDGMFNKFKVNAQSVAENMRNAGALSEVDTPAGKRTKIVDPIEGIAYYYDKNNQMIDMIEANYKDKSNNYVYGYHTVKDFLDAANTQGCDGTKGLACVGIDKDRNLRIYSSWETPPYCISAGVASQSPPIIKTTTDGIKGLACEKRKLGQRSCALAGYETKAEIESAKNKIEKFIVGGADDNADYLVCNLPEMMETTAGGNTWTTETNIYFDDRGNFYAIRTSKSLLTSIADNFANFHFVFKDLNADGTIDEFGQYFVDSSGGGMDKLRNSAEFPQQYYQYRIFKDANGDGATDNLISTNCRVPSAVTITADKGQIKDEYGNNYCYKSKSGTWGVVSTVAMFAGSAFAKTGSGMVVAAAVDCGIAYVELRNAWGLTRSNWPGG